MMTRALVLLCGFAACTLHTCDPATAQPPPNPGTVSWAPNYPKWGDSTPPPTMAMPGWVDYFGTYQANQGWSAVSAVGYWMPKTGGSGGTPQPFTLTIDKGGIGLIDPNTGKLAPARLKLNPGTYQVWMSVIFTDNNKNPVPSRSSVETITIK